MITLATRNKASPIYPKWMYKRSFVSGIYKLYCNLKNRKESKDDLWQFKRLKKEMNFNLFPFFRVRRWSDQILLIWDVETSTNSKLQEKKLKIKFYKKSFQSPSADQQRLQNVNAIVRTEQDAHGCLKYFGFLNYVFIIFMKKIKTANNIL